MVFSNKQASMTKIIKNLCLLLALVCSKLTIAQNDRTIEIKPIADGVYLHTSFKKVEGYGVLDSNGLVVIRDDHAYIIDTPWSEKGTEQLLSWIDNKGHKVAASISTHSHEDRTAGIELLNAKSIPTYTSARTRDILSSQGKATPSNTFDADVYAFGSGLIEFYYPGAGHTIDNLVVWLPESRILFGGCFVRGFEWESLGFTGDASIKDWASSVEKTKSRYRTTKTVVPGHGRVGGVEMLNHTITLAKQAVNQ